MLRSRFSGKFVQNMKGEAHRLKNSKSLEQCALRTCSKVTDSSPARLPEFWLLRGEGRWGVRTACWAPAASSVLSCGHRVQVSLLSLLSRCSWQCRMKNTVFFYYLPQVSVTSLSMGMDFMALLMVEFSVILLRHWIPLSTELLFHILPFSMAPERSESDWHSLDKHVILFCF